MRKILLASVLILAGAGAAGGWYVLNHRDPLQDAKVLLRKGDVRGAALELRSAVRDDPSNPEAHALLGELKLASGDPIAAEREIKQAIRLHWKGAGATAVLAQAYIGQAKWQAILDEIPEHGDTPEQTAYYLMAHALAKRGTKDPAAANALLAQAERLAPQNAEVHVVAARFALADGDTATALKQLDSALALEPQRTEALQLKARLLNASGDRAGALAQLDRAVESAPTRADVLVERAALLLAQGQDAKAREDVAAALKRSPNDRNALFVDVVLLVRERKFAEADQILQKLDPVIANFQRGRYFKAMVKAALGQKSQAEEAAQSYVAHNPDDPDGVRLLARIQLDSGRPGRAVPVLVKAVSAGQTDPETLDLLGRAYAMEGNRAEADNVFKKASAATSDPKRLAELASARLQLGDLAGAATDFQRSLEIGPSQAAAEALVATALKMGDLDRAQAALDRLRQQYGDTESAQLLAGMIKAARFDREGALEQFRATARAFPNSVRARLNEAQILLQLQRPEQAVPVLQGVLDQAPAQPEALSLLVQALTLQNRPADALKAVERARAAEPTNLGIIKGEAELLARLKDYDRAIKLLESTKVGGRVPPGLLPTLGQIQLAAGQTEAAKKTFATLVAEEPNNTGAALANINLLIQLKDFDAARKAADQAIEKRPGDPALLEARVAVEMRDKGVGPALQTAERLQSNPANMPAAAALKGKVLMAAQRYKDAADAFAAELKQNPSSQLAVQLAEATRAAGDPAEADAQLRRWLSAHPDDADVAMALSSSDIKAHRYDDALRNLRVVLDKRPNDPIALNNLAWIYQQKGDLKQARILAQRSFEQLPTPEIVDTLAWTMVLQGEAAKALPLLRSAAAANPNNTSIKYHLAVALKDVNRRDEAASLLRTVLDSGAGTFEEKPAAERLLAELTQTNR